MPHMLPAPPKSSETRAIMLLISRDSEHLQVWPDDAFAEAPLTASLGYAQTANWIESALIRLPLVADAKEKYEGYARSYLLEQSPLALPSSEADQMIHVRH